MPQPAEPPSAPFAILFPFAKQLQKSVGEAVCVVMPARLSVRMSGTEKCTWRIFVEFHTCDVYKRFPAHSDLIKIGKKNNKC